MSPGVATVVGVVPAYETETTVGAVVTRARAHLQHVVVVDDGSMDGTSRAAAGAGAEVIRFERNRGKGVGLLAGFERALARGADAVVTLDADGQHDPAEIPRFLDLWEREGVPLIVGSRAHLEEEMTRLRRFGNRFACGAIAWFAGTPIPDTQSGFRLYDATLLRSVRLTGVRYELESEVLVKAARAGFAIGAVPIRLRTVDGTPTSHFRPFRDTARICVAVVKSRFAA